jgi:transcription elongation factor GreA
MSDQQEGAITAEGLKALRAELDDLEGGARQAIAKRINAARELGDLKENAEYHIAKEDQGHLETKILKLQDRLRRAVVVETPAHGGDVVAFGSTVNVSDEASGRAMTYTIVGPTEADVKEGKLSSESPMATALMGASVGDVVEVAAPRGTRRLKVESLG